MPVFQSTLPYGSDEEAINIIEKADVFQSTLPYGSDMYCAAFLGRSQHFNPRSLTGATNAIQAYNAYFTISIHAPLRERRNSNTFGYRTLANFNPRSLTGATPTNPCRHPPKRFQSTLPYGSDLRARGFNWNIGRFQSTLPYGSDVAALPAGPCKPYFNPRSLTGATQ